MDSKAAKHGTAENSGNLDVRGLDALVKGLGIDDAGEFIHRFFRDPAHFQQLLLGSTLRIHGGVSLGDLPTNPAHSAGPGPALMIPPTGPVRTAPTRVGSVKADARQWLKTGFELLVIPPTGASFSVPLNFEQVTLGSSGERRNDIELNYPGVANKQATLFYQDGQFVLVNETPSLQVHVNGNAVERQGLQDGDHLQMGPARLQLFRLLDIISELQVVSGADIGKRWKLNKSLMFIGRPGQRFNDVELGDLTVSRTHARLEFRKTSYAVAGESVHNPTMVNGEVVHEPRTLEDYDQLAMGESVLLYRIDRARGKRSLRPKEVTLLFSDLRGYSTIAEKEPLKNLIDQLNEYLQEMSQIIKLNGGTLLSYQGDAIMAVFGAPTRHADDPDRAVHSALQMLQKLRQLNEQWVAGGRPEFHCGIGINSGQAMVGDIGIDEHLEYAAMGDDTNIAARIEELTRHYDADVIVSEKTMEKLAGRYQLLCLGQVQIRGRGQPITIYAIKGYQAAVPEGPASETPTPHPAPPTVSVPQAVLGIHDTRSQPEIGLKITLDIDKIEVPRELPVGIWRGQLQAESTVNGALIQYQAEAEMTVDASLVLMFTCHGQAIAKGQPPVPWGLAGNGYFTAADRLSSVFLTFSHGTHTSTWSFPAQIKDT